MGCSARRLRAPSSARYLFTCTSNAAELQHPRQVWHTSFQLTEHIFTTPRLFWLCKIKKRCSNQPNGVTASRIYPMLNGSLVATWFALVLASLSSSASPPPPSAASGLFAALCCPGTSSGFWTAACCLLFFLAITSVLAIRFGQVCTSFEGSMSTLSFLLGPENVLYLLQWRQQSIWRRAGTLGGSEVKDTMGSEASLRRRASMQRRSGSEAVRRHVCWGQTYLSLFLLASKNTILRQPLFVYLLYCMALLDVSLLSQGYVLHCYEQHLKVIFHAS